MDFGVESTEARVDGEEGAGRAEGGGDAGGLSSGSCAEIEDAVMGLEIEGVDDLHGAQVLDEEAFSGGEGGQVASALEEKGIGARGGSPLQVVLIEESGEGVHSEDCGVAAEEDGGRFVGDRKDAEGFVGAEVLKPTGDEERGHRVDLGEVSGEVHSGVVEDRGFETSDAAGGERKRRGVAGGRGIGVVEGDGPGEGTQDGVGETGGGGTIALGELDGVGEHRVMGDFLK